MMKVTFSHNVDIMSFKTLGKLKLAPHFLGILPTAHDVEMDMLNLLKIGANVHN
jgi:hypothetical protein